MGFVPLDLIVFRAWVPPYHRIAASGREFRFLFGKLQVFSPDGLRNRLDR